ncbi:MAG: hypothetical protein KDK97_15490 [Verrucomicrobiales bacterium]|nr:hypothetical protein [Verrucomicrobiales bacterium]MCP5557160.1 hypothetical protein [Verrucomicrobiaceae bacterium]
MKTSSKTWFCALVLFAVQALGTLPASAFTGDELRAMYTSYFEAKGWDPSVDSDGDVRFKTGGKTYFIDVHEKDQEFFMIVLANIWPIESATERIQVIKAVDIVNAETKSAKTYTKGDNVWISYETFLADPRDFKVIFDRAFSSIDTAKDKFVEKMKE